MSRSLIADGRREKTSRPPLRRDPFTTIDQGPPPEKGATLPAASRLSYCYLAYLSQPSCERILYRAIRRNRVRSIVEMGVAMGRRSKRLIQVAQRYQDQGTIRYTGIDLFEDRASHTPGMTLKRAYRTFRQLGVRAQLVPGDPLSALARTANLLVANVDMLVIGADQDQVSLSQAWFYLPRLLHSDSLVFVEETSPGRGRTSYKVLSPAAVSQMAQQRSGGTRRAA